MTTPSISVVMPVHNRAAIVGDAVASVLAQDFDDFELIVVDDGSSDDLEGALARFDDRRLKLVRLEENRGSNAARNAGIAKARGALLAFLDSDDLYLPHKLSDVAAAFAADPALDVRVDSFVKMGGAGAERPWKVMANPDTADSGDFARALYRRDLNKATSAISVRKDAATRAGLFSEGVRQRQDFDFLIRLARTVRCTSAGSVTWIKCRSDQRITSPTRFVEATLDLAERHPEYLSNPDYRPGLARDIVRNTLKLIRAGKIGKAASNVALVIRRLGLGAALRIAGEGIAEVALPVRPASPPSQDLPPATIRAVEAVRNRGSRPT